MICIGCITADKPSSRANTLPPVSRGGVLFGVVLHPHSPFRRSSDRARLRLCCVSHASVGALRCRAAAALVRFLTGRFTSLHPVQLPSSHLRVRDCRGSLSQQSAERREAGGRKKRTGWNIFQGSRHFLSDQPGAVGLQIKSVPKKKRRQQNTDKSFAFQPPPGKVPSSGKASNFPWPTYSLSRLYLSAGSVVGFINEILTAVFSTRVSDGSARASFSITMSSRQIWQVELRRQHIEVN